MKIGTNKGLKNVAPQTTEPASRSVQEKTPDVDPYILNPEFTKVADQLIQLLHNYHVNIKGDSHDRDTVLKEANAILETRA